MPALIYIHGFLSSPRSAKAHQTGAWLAANCPDIDFHCPYLSSLPGEARAVLDDLMNELRGQSVGLVGSSLGGFWATWLVEEYGCRAVLVNPAVRPQARFPDYVGQPLKNYHTEDTYTLSPDDLRIYQALDVERPRRLSHYWLMVQTGDETLDYRDAVARYSGCRQLIEQGGDHSFVDYQRWLPQIATFLFADPS